MPHHRPQKIFFILLPLLRPPSLPFPSPHPPFLVLWLFFASDFFSRHFVSSAFLFDKILLVICSCETLILAFVTRFLLFFFSPHQHSSIKQLQNRSFFLWKIEIEISIKKSFFFVFYFSFCSLLWWIVLILISNFLFVLFCFFFFHFWFPGFQFFFFCLSWRYLAANKPFAICFVVFSHRLSSFLFFLVNFLIKTQYWLILSFLFIQKFK